MYGNGKIERLESKVPQKWSSSSPYDLMFLLSAKIEKKNIEGDTLKLSID